MRRRLTVLTALLFATPANSKGFMIKDLTAVGPIAATALGEGFEGRSEPNHVTLACVTCAGEPVIDILLARQNDGTEGRIRSGRTSIAELERLCRLRSPMCSVKPLNVEPAVGWISDYPLGNGGGSTAVLIRDGQLLTIRSIAENSIVARRSIEKLMPLVRSRIVGP